MVLIAKKEIVDESVHARELVTKLEPERERVRE